MQPHITMSHHAPERSTIHHYITGGIDYSDTFSCEYEHINSYSIDYLAALLFMTEPPAWIKALFTLRHIIAKLLGLRTGKSQINTCFDETRTFSPGDKIGFFPIIAHTHDEIVLAASDRHLAFWVSVLKFDDDNEKTRLWVTTIVQWNNRLGPIYFAVVKPFHILIVKNRLRSLSRLCRPAVVNKNAT